MFHYNQHLSPLHYSYNVAYYIAFLNFIKDRNLYIFNNYIFNYMAYMQKYKPSYSINEDYRGGQKFSTSMVLMQIITEFAKITPSISKESYINYIWYTLYPLTAYLETTNFQNDLKKITDDKKNKVDQLQNQKRQNYGRPLNISETKQIELEVEYQVARDLWLLINRLISDKLGEEKEITDEDIGHTNDDDITITE